MPDMTPVGSMYPPANPLSTLSAIYGIKQQQQNLQTGQYTQQTAQAESQQAQQKNQELQAVGNLTKQAYQSGRYAKPDGSFDNQKFANDVSSVAPTYGQQIANDATSRAGEIYKNQQTLFNLETSKREQVGNMFTSVAGMDKPTQTDLINAEETLRQQYPNDPDLSRMITSMGHAIPPDATGDQLKQFALRMASMTNAPNVEQAFPGSGTNAAGQNQVVNKFTGARSAPQLGPGATNPESPAVAGATAAATLPYVGPAAAASASGSATGTAATSNVTGLASRIQSAKAADYERPQVLDALTRARAILAKPNAPDLGTSFEIKTYLKNALSSLGIDTEGATDANELVKNLARAEAARSQGSAIGNTDAGRRLLSQGTGNTHIDNAAALNIIDQSMATEMAGRGYLRAVTKHPMGSQQQQDAESRYLATPKLIQTYELGLKKTPAEVQSFLQQNGLKRGDLDGSVQALKDQGAL